MAEAIGADPEESSNLRIVMRGIARSWPTLDAAEQERTLRIPPRLTGTDWDPLLAAVTEHVAWLNGHRKPAWVDEPARFNERPRTYTPVRRQDAWVLVTKRLPAPQRARRSTGPRRTRRGTSRLDPSTVRARSTRRRERPCR